jgi:hypothetical protein
MTRNLKFNDTQLVILSAAADRDDRMALPLARSLTLDDATTQKTIKALLKRKLLEEVPAALDATLWRTSDEGAVGLIITDAGLQAIGLGENAEADAELTTDISDQRTTGDKTSRKPDSSAQKGASKKAAAPKTKADSVIALLNRKNGATISNLMSATGWQAHSVRGFISGAVKKRMGLTVTSDKPANGERRYRIVDL